MSISQLFESLHGMLDINKLIPLTSLSSKQLESINLTKKDIRVAEKLLGVSAEHLYLNPEGGIHPYCYWDGLYYDHLVGLQKSQLQVFGDPKFNFDYIFKKRKEHVDELLENEDYESFINMSDKKATFLAYQALKHKIEPEKRKELFLEIYTRNEYGFDRLDQILIREILNMPSPTDYDINQAKVKPDSEGYYTIYRGVTPKSSPLNLSYSWTLSKRTAYFFATRFDSEGTIMEGKVHMNKIKAYIPNRSEEEVLVFPEDVIIEK